MEIVYIADSSPAKKRNRGEDLKQAAILLASRPRVSARRKAQKIYEAVLNEKAVA